MRTVRAWVIGTVVMLAAAGGWAQAGFSGVPGLAKGMSSTSSVPLDVDAKVMEYDVTNRTVVASSNVEVRCGTEEVRADAMRVNFATSGIEARGHVVFTRPGSVWRGDYLRYNFGTGAWNTGAFASYFDPFFVRAQSAVKTNDEYVLQDAYLTTCTNEFPNAHYHMKCKQLRIRPGDRMRGSSAVAYLGPVPVFYFPWLYRSLGDRTVGFSAEAGYSQRMGAFLLTTAKYWMTPNLRGVTQVDERTERGVGLGQEIGWYSDDHKDHGRIYGYYINDRGVDADYNSGDRTTRVDPSRYRLRFSETQALSDRDSFLADANYLSDPFIVEDYFNSEHRGGYQPDNFATLTHRGDDFAADLSVHARLNDFYTAVERLPEGEFNLTRQQLGDSPFYYEGQNSAGFLQKRFANDDTNDTNYSAARFDTAHTVYYPNRFFGFLNVTPRAGYEATFYSETVKTTSNTTISELAGGGSTTSSVVVLSPQGSGVRSMPSLGLESSFKAFKVLDEDETVFGTGMRHVAEPYANYTYVPKPSLTPDELYQFDSLDALGKNDSVTFGVRNRLQTKRDQHVFDFLDVDVNTLYRFEDGGSQPFGDINTVAEFRPIDWVTIYGSVAYGTYDSEVHSGDFRSVVKGEIWQTTLEYYYRVGDSSLVSTDIRWTPNKRWNYGVYERYELRDSHLEEQSYYIGRNYDCLAYRLGIDNLPAYTRADGSVQRDEIRVMFQLWLTAFPNMRMGTTPRS